MGRKRQRPRNKKVNPTFFVFCEGETEEQYVKFLRSQYRIPIEIDSKITGQKIDTGYIKRYKKDKPVHDKDKDFLLFDLDAGDILERLERIREASLLVSNPCFELWYMLHYENQTAEIRCRDCRKRLLKMNMEYRRGVINPRLKSVLQENRKDAVRRAKGLHRFNNPSTTVYLLLEALEEVKKKKDR